jgi:hypothetical protein
MFEYNTNTENGTSMDTIDKFLENEKRQNKSEGWLKLEKTIKIQKLHDYADKYGTDNNLSTNDIELLKRFFNQSLDNNKLNKSKDVIYNKTNKLITSIPALQFNTTTNNFTLKNTDAKRVSTLKSLTPKRNSEKNREPIHIEHDL